MFSQLGPLFKTHLRQAEKSDARLEIRRDDPHDQRKKQDDGGDEDDTSALWEDSTSVSVEALKSFLAEFLRTRGEEVSKPQTHAEDVPALAPEYRPPASTRAARAVAAYGASAAHAAPSAEPPPPEVIEPPRPAVDLVDLLRADEVRTMHVLIAELESLSRRGVQTLTIDKAETFLEALVMAVHREHARG